MAHDRVLYPDAQLLALTGSVVMWWGRIEHLLFTGVLMLKHHAGVASSGVCDPPQIATKRLINQWQKAAKIAADGDAAQIAEVEAVTVELYDVADDRNGIVHSFWPYPMPTQERSLALICVKPTKTGDLIWRQCKMDAELMTKVSDAASRLYHRVLALHLDHLRHQGRPPKVASAPGGASLLAQLPLPTPRPAPAPRDGAGS